MQDAGKGQIKKHFAKKWQKKQEKLETTPKHSLLRNTLGPYLHSWKQSSDRVCTGYKIPLKSHPRKISFWRQYCIGPRRMQGL